MIPVKKCKCKNCRTLFLPDPRNATRQKFCTKPQCRKASKKASQDKWLKQPENQNYFCGPENVKRVQQWRAEHPGYWRRKQSADNIALQDSLISQPAENKKNTDELHRTALQDLLIAQPFVMLGLIANFTGTALQDDIDTTLCRLQQLGRDIADHHINGNKGGHYYGVEKPYPAPTAAPGTVTVQLGGPATGP
jgi:hypothetical protein